MLEARTNRWTLTRWLLAGSLAARAAEAQPPAPEVRPPQATTAFAALSVNALVGGATAALRARLGRRDAARAFVRGTLGGAVHFGGKYVAARPGSASGPLGVAIGATGAAMVANAGRAAPLLDELVLPVGPLRVRLARPDSGAPRRVRLSVNALESVMLARTLAREELRVDWERSAAAGAFVFVAPDHAIELADGSRAGGVAVSSVAVVSGLTPRLAPIVRHEAVHVQQHWFAQEVWARPIEGWLVRRVPALRWVPRWLEPGVALYPIWWLEDRLSSEPYGPFERLTESEAYLLGRE